VAVSEYREMFLSRHRPSGLGYLGSLNYEQLHPMYSVSRSIHYFRVGSYLIKPPKGVKGLTHSVNPV